MDQCTTPASTTGPLRSGLYHLLPDGSVDCIFGAPLDGEAIGVLRDMTPDPDSAEGDRPGVRKSGTDFLVRIPLANGSAIWRIPASTGMDASAIHALAADAKALLANRNSAPDGGTSNQSAPWMGPLLERLAAIPRSTRAATMRRVLTAISDTTGWRHITAIRLRDGQVKSIREALAYASEKPPSIRILNNRVAALDPPHAAFNRSDQNITDDPEALTYMDQFDVEGFAISLPDDTGIGLYAEGNIDPEQLVLTRHAIALWSKRRDNTNRRWTTRIVAAAAAIALLTSAADSRDRFDSVTGGTGNNAIILGGDDDAVSVTGGVDIIVADLGSINLTTGTVTQTSDDNAGNDSITAADGDNIILGGAFEDDIAVGNGNNAILTDIGTVNYDVATGAQQTIISATDTRDGSDSVTAGSGNNAMVLGGDTDQVSVTGGNDIIVTDSGSINLTNGVAIQTSDANAGNDTVTAADGDNIILTGAFEDRIVVGNGDNAILTETGTVVFDAANRQAQILVSIFDARDSSDSVTAGNGDNWVILGGESDTGSFGNGDNIVLGDSGLINDIAAGQRVAQTSDEGTGAADSITVAAGADVVMAGDGADNVLATGGNNFITGDSGATTLTASVPTNEVLSFASRAADIGDGDTIVTAAGIDVIVAGTGNDSVDSGGGNDIVAGDWVSIITSAGGGGSGTILSTDVGVVGQDSITSGSANDIVIGGGDSDEINVGTGFDTGIGDNARVTYVNTTDINALVLTELALGASDTITAECTGDNLLVGQFGADTLTGGDDRDVMVGDLATFGFLPFGTNGVTGSHIDRLVDIVFIRPDIGFDDVLIGNGGNDFLLAGFGNDQAFGGDGQDLLAGDDFDISIVYELDAAGEPQTQNLFFESNFPTTGGGFDNLDPGDGPDIVIGGLGPDGFDNTNTEDDFLAGDAVALFLQAPFAPSGGRNAAASGPTPVTPFGLIQVNFPGSGDLLSTSQVSSSLGFDLNNFGEAGDEDTGVPAINDLIASGLTGDALITQLSERASALFDLLQSTVTSQQTVEQIAQLLQLDIPQDVLVEMLQNGLSDQIAAALGGELTLLDRYILIRLLEEVVEPALQAAAA